MCVSLFFFPDPEESQISISRSVILVPVTAAAPVATAPPLTLVVVIMNAQPDGNPLSFLNYKKHIKRYIEIHAFTTAVNHMGIYNGTSLTIYFLILIVIDERFSHMHDLIKF